MFPKPIVEENRCLRSGPGRSGCTECQDVCPHFPGFILNGGTVTLPSECDSCHLCTAACLEGAISGMLPPPRLLNQDEIVLRCEWVHEPGAASMACVGAIPKAFLEVAAVRKRAVHLVTGPCEQCERHVGLALYEKRIARIQETRSLVWDRRELPFSEAPERRRLLGWLARSVIPNRMRASEYREMLSEEFISDADRVYPKFTDRCVGCPVCEVVCPHHVFHRHETDRGVSFQIMDQHCTGCGKCIDSCLLQGITLEGSSHRGVRKVDLERQICPDCKEIFNGRVDACPRCRMAETQGLAASAGNWNAKR